MKQCGNMAASLVDQRWSAVVRVARALAEAELSGTELERLTALHFVT
jgi:hypothetical protein